MNRNVKISPSILSADFSRLGEEMRRLDASEAEYVHIDVMDGHFVPNLTFGPPVIKSLRPYTKKVFDVHLMVKNPGGYFEAWKDAGADILGIHREIEGDLKEMLRRIKALGMRSCLTYNPDTSVEDLGEFLPHLDQVLLMSVFPGFGGQKFIEATLDRGRKAREIIDASGRRVDLEIDGGVFSGNAKAVREAGFDVLVAGSAIFNAPDFGQAIRSLRGS